MKDNPFRPPEAGLSEVKTELSVGWQPYAFASIPFLASFGMIAISVLWSWLFGAGQMAGAFFDGEFLLMFVCQRAISVLPSGVMVLLFVHWQRDRHCIAGFHPLPGMLTTFALLYGIATMLALAVYGLEMTYLNLPGGLIIRDMFLLLGCMAGLWLVLRVYRRKAERLVSGQVIEVAGGQVVLAVTLVAGMLWIKALEYFFVVQIEHYNGYVQLLGGGLGCVVILAAGWRYRSRHLSRFPVHRVLVAALMIVVLWGLACGLTGWSTWQLLSDVENNRLADVILLPAILALLALLWPITRLSLRFCFPGERWAQSSPR